jgi:hypothetical protein
MNTGPTSTGLSRLTGVLAGQGLFSQVLLAIIACLILFIVMLGLESIYWSIMRLNKRYVEVMPNTYVSENKMHVIRQSPSAPGAITLPLSDNERTGIEFSYSFFLFVNPSTFRTEQGLCHIFHKGYSKQYPLMGPGVYMHSNDNKMRVYMSTFNTWNNYIDIENIPVKKWLHCVVMCRKSALEVYINGNLVKKMKMEGEAVPYQNYGDLYVFSQRTVRMLPSKIPSLDGEGLSIFGTYSGMLSRLTYFPYALSYSEIRSTMDVGPSKKIESGSEEVPPYLIDTWWTTKYE